MQLSTRGRYAVMAMVDLATRARCAVPPCPPVCLSEIAASQQLSLAYLEQLFGKLRRAGLVTSMRGPGGGYRLARPAHQVPIAAIAAAVDEAIHATRCEVGEAGCMAGAGPDGTAGRCQTHDLWAELGRQIRLFLEGVTLADVIDGQVAGRAVPIATAPPPLEGLGREADRGRGQGFSAEVKPKHLGTPHDIAAAAATLAAE
jgi:Rrf2 family iron-sulfur cluster assembly transcriptional regulator